MEEQMSEALVKVKSVLSDVKMSVQSVSKKSMLLPHISDILSEISNIVSCVNHCPDGTIKSEDEEELWWDSSPENVNYSDSDPCDLDDESCVVSTILFSSDSSSMSSLPSILQESDEAKIFY